MATQTAAPWHKASYDRFMHERLCGLLGERLPLASCGVVHTGPHDCRVRIVVSAGAEEIGVDYDGIPVPGDDGVFEIAGRRLVVVPLASREELDQAAVCCVGEQLADFVAARLGDAPPGMSWSVEILRSWLPLDKWFAEFFAGEAAPSPAGREQYATVQQLDESNWLARCEHLRRILVPDRKEVFPPGQFGLACPIQTPEGDNIGRVLTIAVGAEVRDGRLRVRDGAGGRPESMLSAGAAMIPFIEHSDPNRLLMGVNMMRQWIAPDDPEPALVQTGNEPAAREFWCGRNLLTAFVSWGADTYEDSLVVSQSAARRLGYSQPLTVGDKLSNRHGIKATVGRILPDDEMPHLSDGAAVDLVYNFIGLHTRLVFGLIREAVMGRIARAENRGRQSSVAGECAPVIVPPFGAPSAGELRRRLRQAGLDESGMETLTDGKGGPRLERPSTVGYVYWGKTVHLAADKVFAHVVPPGGTRQGELECFAMRDAGAYENALETFNTRSAMREDAATLAARVAAGPIEQATAPSPAFAKIVRRLAAAGIAAEVKDGKLSLRFTPTPGGESLELTRTVDHPWLPWLRLSRIGVMNDMPEYAAVARANAKLQQMLAADPPELMLRGAYNQLKQRLAEFCDALLPSGPFADDRGRVRFGNRVLFSGRAVISPGGDLRSDQVGLAEEIAWTLFGPLVQRELGAAQPPPRDAKTTAVLDRIMADSWVLINRAPTLSPTAMVAFHPVRIPDSVIRLHPLACMFLNADFDGDQVAVLLPLTAAAQREAGEKLSMAGHLRRDGGLIRWAPIHMECLMGLAWPGLKPGGREEIAKLAGIEVPVSDGIVTRGAIEQAARKLLQRDGAEKTLEALERLTRRGFEAARKSGASMSPFIGEGIESSRMAAADATAYEESVCRQLAARRDYDDELLGPQLLAVATGARGGWRQLTTLLAPTAVYDAMGCLVHADHGMYEGLTPSEFYTRCIGARRGMALTVMGYLPTGYDSDRPREPHGAGVLARAMRADRPGPVFARAAMLGEVDHLTDIDSRLFIGLPVSG